MVSYCPYNIRGLIFLASVSSSVLSAPLLCSIRVLVRFGGWVALPTGAPYAHFALVIILLVCTKLMYTADILLGPEFNKFNKALATGAGIDEPRGGYTEWPLITLYNLRM